MIKYNREKFFALYANKIGGLDLIRREALNFLLTKLENSRRIETEPKRAYTLATVKWETANMFAPITELGSNDYLRSKPYWPYIGRGYCQLTWRKNYKQFGDYLKIDLVNHPDKALDPEIAWKILEVGMTDDFGIKDPDFTAYTLEDFFSKGHNDYRNARRIVNPRDYKSFEPIANFATIIVSILIICKEEVKIQPEPLQIIPKPEIKEEIKKAGFFSWIKNIFTKEN